MLKPVKHVHGKASSKFTHIDIPRVNVYEVLQGHIKNFEISLNNVEDLATVKTVKIKPLAPESVLLNDKIFSNDRNMYDIIIIILLGIVYVYMIFITYKYVYATKCVKVKTENLGIKKEIPTVKDEILIDNNDVPLVKEEVQIIEDNKESWQIDSHDDTTICGDLLMRHRRECESDGHPY